MRVYRGLRLESSRACCEIIALDAGSPHVKCWVGYIICYDSQQAMLTGGVAVEGDADTT